MVACTYIYMWRELRKKTATDRHEIDKEKTRAKRTIFFCVMGNETIENFEVNRNLQIAASLHTHSLL